MTPFLGSMLTWLAPYAEWAFKLPILAAVYVMLFIVLWIGYTMATTPHRSCSTTPSTSRRMGRARSRKCSLFIRAVVGQARALRDMLNASPFALAFIVGVLQLLQVLHVNFSVMEHRMWLEVPFDVGWDLEWPVLLLAAVCVGVLVWRRSIYVAFPLVSVVSYTFWGFSVAVPVVALAAFLGGVLELRSWRGFVFSLLGVLSVVELGSVVHWLLYAVMGVDAPLRGVAYLEECLFYILTPVSLVAMAAIVVLCLVLPLRLWLIGVKRAEGLAGIMKGSPQGDLTSEKPIWKRGRWTTILLLALICYAAFSALYPSLPMVNPSRVDLGVDVSDYVSDLGNISNDFGYVFKAEGGSRPLFFVFLTGFQRALGFSAFDAIAYAPIVLAPVLTLSVFYLALEVLRDEEYALWASFFTVAGFHLVIGLYSFFLANMLGLSIAFAMLIFVFRFFRRPRFLEGFLAALFAVGLLFTHPWTFDQYVAALAPAVLFVALRGESREARLLSRIGVILSVALLGGTELLLTRLLGGVGGLASLNAFLTTFTSWERLASSFYESVFYYNGLFACTFLLILVVLGLYSWRIRGVVGVYFSSFLLFSTIMYLLVEVDTKDRLLYNYPLGVLAAGGLMWVQGKRGDYPRRIVPVFFALALIAYQLRSLANLV